MLPLGTTEEASNRRYSRGIAHFRRSDPISIQLLAGSQSSVPGPFLVILLFWLTITFTSFGLFAPRNATVLAGLFVCALSVGSAVFLVLEMGAPFNGVLRVSAEPLRYAHSHMDE